MALQGHLHITSPSPAPRAKPGVACGMKSALVPSSLLLHEQQLRELGCFSLEKRVR